MAKKKRRRRGNEGKNRKPEQEAKQSQFSSHAVSPSPDKVVSAPSNKVWSLGNTLTLIATGVIAFAGIQTWRSTSKSAATQKLMSQFAQDANQTQKAIRKAFEQQVHPLVSITLVPPRSPEELRVMNVGSHEIRILKLTLRKLDGKVPFIKLERQSPVLPGKFSWAPIVEGAQEIITTIAESSKPVMILEFEVATVPHGQPFTKTLEFSYDRLENKWLSSRIDVAPPQEPPVDSAATSF